MEGLIRREAHEKGVEDALTETMKYRYYEKLWHEIIDDLKLGPLPAELKWRFVQLIVMAGLQDEGGLLPELPDMAFRLRLTEEQLRTDLPTLARRELVELVPTSSGERWLLTNWVKRQEPADAAARQRRSRGRRASSSSSSSSSGISKKEEEIEIEIEIDNVTRSVAKRDKNVTAELLAAAGIARNRTTAPLWELDPEYVRAHLKNEPKPNYAIRKMLDGSPPPRRRDDLDTLLNQIPEHLKGVIKS